MGENFRLIVGILKCKFYKATMTQAQLDLYDVVGKTMTSDAAKKEVTLVVPANVDSKDLKKVKRQFELESGDGAGWPVRFVTGGNPGGASPSVGNNPKP